MKSKTAVIGKGNVGGALGGGLERAGYEVRSLEALGFFNIQLGFALQRGPGIGFKLVH